MIKKRKFSVTHLFIYTETLIIVYEKGITKDEKTYFIYAMQYRNFVYDVHECRKRSGDQSGYEDCGWFLSYTGG